MKPAAVVFGALILLAVPQSWARGPNLCDAAGEPPVQAPVPRARALALGYAGSVVRVDTASGSDERVTPNGWGALARADLEEHWGLQLQYAVKDGRLGSGDEIRLAQAGLYAYLAWETPVSDWNLLRAYPKFGLAWTSFEETLATDEAFGPSIGGGLEYGTSRWGLVFDVSWTLVEIALASGEDEHHTVGAGFLGIAYRF